MYNLAICDDDLMFGKMASTKLKNYFPKFNVYLYNDPVMLLEEYPDMRYEAVLMDINMEPLSGYETSDRLRRINRDIIIAFITGTDTPVDSSLRFRPVDFVRKDNWEEDILETFPVIEKELELYNDVLVINVGNTTYQMKYGEILYLESDHNDLVIHKMNETLKIRKTLKSLSDDLINHKFLIINKGLMINTNQVKTLKLSALQIVMKNNDLLYISRTRKNAVKEFYSGNR